jgi:hypothetical protein
MKKESTGSSAMRICWLPGKRRRRKKVDGRRKKKRRQRDETAVPESGCPASGAAAGDDTPLLPKLAPL